MKSVDERVPSSSNKLGLIECILYLRKPMWQVGIVPAKLTDALGSLVRYAQESLNIFFCPTKARRKERDGDSNQGDTKLYLEEGLLERKLPDADLRLLVDLPAGLDYNEWLASHTLALFEHVNLVYGTISEFCTTSGCPDMTGPGTRMYLWFDEKGKKTRVAAPQYIDYVMTFTQKTVSDESIFPTKYANEFPSSFESIARKIVRLLFHVIAHLYAAHFREVALLGLHAHLNLTFAHLTAFHRRYNLIESKETEVLRDLEIALRLTDDPTAAVDKDSSASIVSTTVSSSSSSSTGATNANSTSNNNNNNSSNNNHNATICSSSSNSSTASSSPPLLLPGSATNQATGNHTNNACSSSSSPNIGRCAENNNSSSSDNAPFGAGATLIDGDATAQPICKQPLESGGSSCVVNSCSNHQHPPGSGAGGNPLLGGKDQQQQHHHHHHHQHMMMQSSCGGSGSSTGSVGVVGCGVGYSVVAGGAGGGGGGGGGTGGGGAGGGGSASAANAQPTA
ncbi:MOB kinase activator-like 2 isoform X3 [Anopheles aquasalis]|uniref:MOB kinase activator-like 2 isoform X3 n=1 Tax=Anopheles aquasalis TaxID=42839 RepID=UPI00215AA392|nr:MOB kinase activator-like 2 isoform X3 [Anopheles aquasalis]